MLRGAFGIGARVSSVLALAALSLAAQSKPAAPRLPAPLESYVSSSVKLDAKATADLHAGRPVTKLLNSDPAKEVAVFGAVWINAAPSAYAAAVRDIEQFEKGPSFRATKKIGAPPRLDDFAAMTIPDDDFKDLRSCRVGECSLKLSQSTIERVRREVDFSKPTAKAAVETMMRQLALDYVKAYLDGGNSRLAVYRDSERPTFVAQETRSMIEGLPSLSQFLPELNRYLLDFPSATLAGSESFVYWQEATFGLKPTIRINHVVIAEQPTQVVVASKLLYASHYFWTALELRVLVADPARGPGAWFVSVNRSRSDGLTGFTGRLIRGKVRSEAQSAMTTILRVTKTRLEGRAK